MKLLLDENLSVRILQLIDTDFPGSSHVKECDLVHQSDQKVWEFSRANGFAILSKDWDFHQMSLLRGFPPKVIFLKIGNCSTETIVSLLVDHSMNISEFLGDETASLLILEK